MVIRTFPGKINATFRYSILFINIQLQPKMVNGMMSDSHSPQNLSIIIQTKNPTVGGVFYYLFKLIRDLLFGSVHQELRMPCMKRLQN